MEHVLNTILQRVQQCPDSKCWWDAFQAECASFHARPACTLAQLKLRDDKKQHGDLWELFCLRYLVHHRGARAAWLLKDVPAAVRAGLSLGNMDLGIDIVAVDGQGSYWAVQCKWRAPSTAKTQRIPWAQLATFYALAARTGPYAKHLVLTNAAGARRVGARQAEDETVASAGFKKMTRDAWARMLPVAAVIAAPVLNIQFIRDARIKALTQSPAAPLRAAPPACPS